MVTKSDLHRMIDELRDDEVEEAARLLRDLDRLPPILAEAEEDDEPLTEEEEWMLQESAKDIKAGRIHSHEEIKREFGLCFAEVPTDGASEWARRLARGV